MKINPGRIRLYIFIFIVVAIAYSLILYVKIKKLEFAPEPPAFELDIEKITIQQGDLLALTFKNTRLSSDDSAEILKELRKNVNINKCMPGDFYEIVYSSVTKQWEKFWYYPSGAEFYSITKDADGTVICSKKTLSKSATNFIISGVIQSSLWNAMAARDIPPDIIVSFADIFAWQMDFLTDTRKDDTFIVMYELEKTNKKNSKISSRVLAARYKTSSKTHTAVFFKTGSGQSGYFDEDGKSVKSAFLKAPLQFKRISSHFTTARKHPILKYVRPHLGIDYAAPAGTPVSAIGDGIVTKAQYDKKGMGNMVILKHSNGYETYYGHLSKYGKGIRKGVRVSQGQIIAYVGSTGLSTGPHLDFRIKKDGKFFNFLTIKQPPTTTLSGKDKSDFLSYTANILAEFNNPINENSVQKDKNTETEDEISVPELEEQPRH
jgi:Membrane proteins related to metalloendopeptidases